MRRAIAARRTARVGSAVVRHRETDMASTGGDPTPIADEETQVLAWQFLIEASKVSFGAMASFAVPTSTPPR